MATSSQPIRSTFLQELLLVPAMLILRLVGKTYEFISRKWERCIFQQLMHALTLDPNPVYERNTIVKRAVSCPVFVKAAPISSASIFAARWVSNLTTTLLGIAQAIYSFSASLLWAGVTSGKAIELITNTSNWFAMISFAISSNIPSRNGARQTQTCSRRYASLLQGIYPLPIENIAAKIVQCVVFHVRFFICLSKIS